MPSGGGNRWKPTARDLEQIETMCALTMPLEHIAQIIGVAKDTIERGMKRSEKIRDAVNRGRAKGAGAVYKSAYTMATSGAHPSMTIFWLKCRERWREFDGEDMQEIANKIVTLAYDRSKRFEKPKAEETK